MLLASTSGIVIGLLGLLWWFVTSLPIDDCDVLVYHPPADGGGGGEKCCWATILSLARTATTPTKIGLFIRADCPSGPRILSKSAAKDFQLKFENDMYPRINVSDPSLAGLSDNVTLKLIPLRTYWAYSYGYRKMTRLLQMIGGLITGLEAAFRTLKSTKKNCQVIDTIGCAPALFVLKILTRRKCRTYVHWPFIDEYVLKRYPVGSIGWFYDAVLLFLYKELGRIAYSEPILCNSTFTFSRLANLWNKETLIEFPPVDDPPKRALMTKPIVISIGQFRPEKQHRRQIDIIRYTLLNKVVPENTQFLIFGSCRPDSTDPEFVNDLFDYARQTLPVDRCRLELVRYIKVLTSTPKRSVVPSENHHGTCCQVQIILDAPKSLIVENMAIARVGLHTMEAEHFGIVVADMWVSGLYVVAHNSGGPKYDILTPETGCLANTNEDFAKGITEGLCKVTHFEHETKPFLNAVDFGDTLIKHWSSKFD